MNIPSTFSSPGSGFKAKQQKFGILTLIFFLLFGSVFALVGYFVINSFQVDPSWKHTAGEVVDSSSKISDSSTTYTAVVKYSVNGRSYSVTSSFGSSFAPTIGESREVAYNPSQPNQAKVVEGIGSTWWLWIFPVVGGIILIATPISFIRSLRRSQKIKTLLQTGQKLEGVLVDIQSTSNTSDSAARKIVVAATDSNGVVQNYVSDTIGGVGALAMSDFRTSPIAIDVYVDTLNPKNYYIDIADIPNLTPQRIKELIEQATRKNQQPQTVLSADTQATSGSTPSPIPPSLPKP